MRELRRIRLRAWHAVCHAILCGSVGCGEQFSPPSEIDGLRVLAVKKSSPYVRPGETVELDLLWHDTDGDGLVPQVAWVVGCDNPPGDLYEACLEGMTAELSRGPSDRVSLPSTSAGVNGRFAVTAPGEIISARPPPPSPGAIPYGLQYVFFAVCTGQLGVVENADVPFVCYAEQDGLDGFGIGDARLGARDFVAGYTSVLAYDALVNRNPIIRGVRFNGLTLVATDMDTAAPFDGAVTLLEPDLCIGSACAAPEAGDDARPCPDALTLQACAGGCGRVPFQPIIDSSVAEVDESASMLGSATLEEQMWVNYYSAGGEVADEVRLLNDAALGWNEGFGTEYEPAPEARVSYLWAVAHDNRGGTEWARLRVCTR